jgi:anti-sigma factor RsiW
MERVNAMVETQETFTEREEIEMLLPWYVSGRLDAADHERVERYLEAHPDMKMQLGLVRDEQGETISVNEALRGAPAGALDRLREAISAEPKRLTLATAQRSIWNEMARLFSAPTPRAVQWAAAAALVLFIAQAALIGGLMSGAPIADGTGQPQVAQDERRPYQTASGTRADGTRVQVRFAETVTADALASFLRAERLEIVAGPRPGGYFEVRISKDNLSQTERDAAIARLEAKPDVIKEVMR